MAKKEENNYTLESVNDIEISKLSISELLEYKTASELLYAYYDNLSKANMGTYDAYSKDEYIKAKELTNRYLSIQSKIFDEIKRNVDRLK